MERTEVLDMMGELKLFGMKAAYDETLAVAVKRKHEPQRFIGDLLKAEISEKQARSIKYQMAIARRRRRLPRPAAQRRPGRRNRNRKDPSRHRHRAKLHPSRIARPLLHHRRSRQPARSRNTRRSPGPYR